MDLSLLRSLVVVAEAGAITEAAERLGITQPALTRRIQQLERELGASLLVRGRRGADLTEIGRIVEAEARVMIERYEHLKRTIAARQSVDGGTVRIGGGATAVSFVLPNAIAAFQHEHPRVHFQVKEAGSREIAADVADGRLELGLVTLPVRSSELDIEPVVDDHIVLIAAPDHLFCGCRQIAIHDLDGQNLVGFEAGSAIRQLIDARLREAGVVMNVVMELRSIPTILRMVATTGNLAFVSRLGVNDQDLVQPIAVSGLSITRHVGLARRKGFELSPAAERFAQLLTGG